MKHLSPAKSLPTQDDLILLVEPESPASLFVARIDERIVGMVILVEFMTPTGWKARIEDVVVLPEYMGKGIATALMNSATDASRNGVATNLDLTSRPSRTAAHRLYKKLGFEERQTTVYRYKL